MTLADRAIRWYAAAARDLPWRHPDATPWAVLVSEVMLQQTPVARVLPKYHEWIGPLAHAGRLGCGAGRGGYRGLGAAGYPRRALRLHECAVAITGEHAGRVPARARCVT